LPGLQDVQNPVVEAQLMQLLHGVHYVADVLVEKVLIGQTSQAEVVLLKN
jgi:hypothetical protein